MKNKKWFLGLAILIAFISIVLLILYLNQPKKFDMELINDSPFLGSQAAENSLLFVFDYSCPYCHIWIDEILPQINENIQKGEVKFYAQSVVYLNDYSLAMSKFDHNLKQHFPEKYFDVFFRLVQDTRKEDWGSQSYFLDLIHEFQLNSDLLLEEPENDVISITRKFTRNYELEVVPTLIINGYKVKDPFNLKEIKSYFK